MSLTRKYKVTFAKYPAVLTVVYYNGSFKRIVHDKGQLADKLWVALTKAIPKYESEIKAYNKKYEGKVIIEPITKENDKEVTLYTQFLRGYWSFFMNQCDGKKPNMTNIEGDNLHKIVRYFQDNAKDDHHALLEWEAILRDWGKLTKHYQTQVKFQQIFSNLNNILMQLKGNSNSIDEAFKDIKMPTDKNF